MTATWQHCEEVGAGLGSFENRPNIFGNDCLFVTLSYRMRFEHPANISHNVIRDEVDHLKQTVLRHSAEVILIDCNSIPMFLLEYSSNW